MTVQQGGFADLPGSIVHTGFPARERLAIGWIVSLNILALAGGYDGVRDDVDARTPGGAPLFRRCGDEPSRHSQKLHWVTPAASALDAK